MTNSFRSHLYLYDWFVSSQKDYWSKCGNELNFSIDFNLFFYDFLSEWIPTSGRSISVTGCNQSQVVCAIGPSLYYLEVK